MQPSPPGFRSRALALTALVLATVFALGIAAKRSPQDLLLVDDVELRVDASQRWSLDVDCGTKTPMLVLAIADADLAAAAAAGAGVRLPVAGEAVTINVVVEDLDGVGRAASFSGYGTTHRGLIFAADRRRIAAVRIDTDHAITIRRVAMLCSRNK